MAVSLRTRLTIWYSALLLLGVVLFSATVLWLYWRALVRQSDESLSALSTTAVNVVSNELGEAATLAAASNEMAAVLRHPDYIVGVFDGSGRAVREMPVSLLMAPPVEPIARRVASTVASSDGRRWRLMLRPGDSNGQRFVVAIAAPLDEITEHWRRLLEACAGGIPFVLMLAAAGGWALGRRGLRPLETIATQAREITAQTPDARLTVAGAGPELDDVATSFNRVLDRLNTALATQRRFMADASHELRTPVSIMRTAADVTLSQDDRETAEYREALTAVSQQSSRLTRLVDDMLVLARADAGGYPMAPAEVDLDAVIDDCVRELGPRAATKQIRVTAHLEPISVMADEAMLRRMFGNLLANAIIYTPAGGEITITMALGSGSVAVKIVDTGTGIPAADRERVFERFVRLDPARGEGGAGLGLSIARWVAEAHGGHLDLLTSGPDGSVFSVSIPA